MRGKDFVDMQAKGIAKKFDEIGKNDTWVIIRRLQAWPKIPDNISGAIDKEYGALKAERREAGQWRMKKEGLGTSLECSEIGRFNDELTLWHRMGLADTNKNGSTVPMAIEEWIRAGRPATWSPVLDHWLQGFEVAYKQDLQVEGSLLAFLARYNNMLVEQRKERLAKRAEKAREERAEAVKEFIKDSVAA